MADIKFQKLTPTDNADINGYEEGFQFIFANEDIRNVAIFGPYASGKSSVLKSYEKKHNIEKEFIHISLAHFSANENESSDYLAQKEKKNSQRKEAESDKINIQNLVQNGNNIGGIEPNEKFENSLEGKIINHIINQIPVRRIPYTRFQTRRGSKKINSALITVGIAVIIFALLYFTHITAWDSWVGSISRSNWRNLFNFTMTHGFQVILALIAAILFFYGIYRLILLQTNRRFLKRLSLHGNEIELFADSGDSYFDKYLKEILYLFSRIKQKVVVFEDIDRFANVQIFERLREINTLVNYCNKKPIKFFYLLKDDVYITKDRAKFFDYIMPIVPIINGSNAYNMLKQFLNEAKIFEKFDDYFLREISFYFDDIRIIKNIVNEFIIFSIQLEKIGLNYNKLMAIMAYKNLFPQDYVLLQQGKGYVFNFFKEELGLERKEKKWHIFPTESESRPTMAERFVQDSEFEKFNDTIKAQMGKEQNGTEEYNKVINNEYYSLLAYLLKEGFIDETYNDYIVLFHPNDLTPNDKKFLRGITDRNFKGYDYHLNDPARVFEDIAPKRFVQKEVLNFDLMDYLLSVDGKDEKESLFKIVSQLSETRNTAFVISFFCTNREQENFVQFVNQVWPEFFSLIYKEAKEDENLCNIVRKYSEMTLLYCSEAMLEDVNENACLSDYISAQADYLNMPNLSDEKKETLIMAMKKIGVRFNAIDEEKSDSSLLIKVYEASLYALNVRNLKLFLRLRYYFPNENESYSRCLTIIYSKPDEALCGYIMQNPEDAIAALLKITKGQICDDEDIVVSCLNNNKISLDLRKKYLSQNRTKINTLGDIQEKELYNLLLTSDSLVVSAENIYCYYMACNFTEMLAVFINSATKKLNYNALDITDAEKQKFLKAATKSKNLDMKHYKEIIKGMNCEIKLLDQRDFQEDKLILLIQENKIIRSDQNLNFIRSHCPGVLRTYITTNFEKYLSDIKSNIASHIKEAKEVLLFEEIPATERILLFKMLPPSSNKSSLYLDFALLIEILEDQSISDKSMKRTLVQNVIISFDVEKQEQLLTSLGGEEIVKAMRPNQKKNVAKTEPNRLLLQMLKDAGVIKEFHPSGARYEFTMSKTASQKE